MLLKIGNFPNCSGNKIFHLHIMVGFTWFIYLPQQAYQQPLSRPYYHSSPMLYHRLLITCIGMGGVSVDHTLGLGSHRLTLALGSHRLSSNNNTPHCLHSSLYRITDSYDGWPVVHSGFTPCVP